MYRLLTELSVATDEIHIESKLQSCLKNPSAIWQKPISLQSVFLETSSIDRLPENSPRETGDLSKEEEAALFCRNPSEDEETENEIPCVQANQELMNKTNEKPIETRKAKSLYVQ